MCRIRILYVYVYLTLISPASAGYLIAPACVYFVLHSLRIFKDGAHRRKTEFMLGSGSGVNFASDTGSLENDVLPT